VGHIAAAACRSPRSLSLGCPCLSALPFGVGQFFAISPNDAVSIFLFVPLFGASGMVSGVGQDEEAFALVRRADVRSLDERRLSHVAHLR